MDKHVIERTGNLCGLFPWPAKIGPLLTYTRVVYEYGAGKKNKPKRFREKLYYIQEGVGYFPAGLLSKVVRWLKERNLNYEIRDLRDLTKLYPKPDLSKVSSLRAGQADILARLLTFDRGIIKCSTGYGKTYLIVQLCKVYPTLKIVITAPGIEEVRNIYDRLIEELPKEEVGAFYSGNSTGHNKRVVVVTNRSLLKADLERCDLFICDEVHSVGYNDVADNILYVRRARMFGFSATPTGRGDRTDMIVEALFGEIIAEVGYEDAVEADTVAPIEVWWLPSEGMSCTAVSDVSKKRHLLWRNKKRNKKIAEAARSFPEDEQVLIIVETVEHAVYLKKLLPEFTLVHGGNSNVDGYKLMGMDTGETMTPSLRKKLKKDFAEGKLKKVISTYVWKQAVDFPQLSVLIRADASPGEIPSNQIPGRLSRKAKGKNKGILIDFRDEFDRWLYFRAKKRLENYLKNGWRVIWDEL